jgi:glycosyltransferase involved in cell wall biosynthesis
VKTYIFLPPLPRGSGGLAVLRRMGVFLHKAGFPVRFVLREASSNAEESGVDILPWQELRLQADDIWLTPEGWPNALLPGLKAGARSIVYAQNWAYLLSCQPQGVHLENLPLEFLAVSEPVARFVDMSLGKHAAVLRPGVDTALFCPPLERKDGETVRIAFMPRKNKVFARQIGELAEVRLRRRTQPLPLEWVSIEDRSQAEVARILQTAHLFLCTGFPEGCPLPPLEALACGCVPVGFTGLGGWDYMRQATDFHGGAVPLWPLRETPWAGNGFYAADGDVPGTVLALEAALNVLARGSEELADLRRAGQMTAAAYSLEAQELAVTALWRELTTR